MHLSNSWCLDLFQVGILLILDDATCSLRFRYITDELTGFPLVSSQQLRLRTNNRLFPLYRDMNLWLFFKTVCFTMRCSTILIDISTETLAHFHTRLFGLLQQIWKVKHLFVCKLGVVRSSRCLTFRTGALLPVVTFFVTVTLQPFVQFPPFHMI